MTGSEVCERFHIPAKILEEYKSWGLCGAVRLAMDNWQYDDTDLERLSMIMALHDIGFQKDEVEVYMRLLIKGDITRRERMQMLDAKRNKTLDEIHLKEKQLEHMDYLRIEMRESGKGK